MLTTTRSVCGESAEQRRDPVGRRLPDGDRQEPETFAQQPLQERQLYLERVLRQGAASSSTPPGLDSDLPQIGVDRDVSPSGVRQVFDAGTAHPRSGTK